MNSLSSRSKALSGIAAMVLAMFLLPLVDGLSKLLSITYSAEQITWARNAVHAMVILPLCLWQWRNDGLQFSRSWLHLLRGVAFVLMTLSYIVALSYMPLADALAIVFLFPLLVVVLSAALLGEQVGRVRWLAVLLGFLGVCLVIRPGWITWNTGWVFALIAALMTTLYVLLTRRMATANSALVLLLIPGLSGAFLLLPLLPAVWVTPALGDGIIMVSIGLLAAMVHLLIIVAYARAEASLIAPLAYLQIVMGVVVGFTLFADLPDAWGGLGLLIVIANGVLLAVRNR